MSSILATHRVMDYPKFTEARSVFPSSMPFRYNAGFGLDWLIDWLYFDILSRSRFSLFAPCIATARLGNKHCSWYVQGKRGKDEQISHKHTTKDLQPQLKIFNRNC